MEKACNSQAGGDLDGFLPLILLHGASLFTDDVAALPGDGTSAAGTSAGGTASAGGSFDEELLALTATSVELPGAATQGTSSTKLISISGGTASALPLLPPSAPARG
jgi:hypothetical protein